MNSVEKPYSPRDGDVKLHEMSLDRQITLTNEQFERLYLHTGDARKAKPFADPALIGLASFIACLAPITYQLMGWGDASAETQVWQTGPFYFLGVGGLGLTGIFEFIRADSLRCGIFLFFAFYFGSCGYNQDPTNSVASIDAVAGLTGKAFFYLTMGMLTVIFFVGSLSVNVVTAIQFLSLDLAFWFLGSASLKASRLELKHVSTLLKAAGGCAFVTCLCGLYLLLSRVVEIAELPFYLPVGSLSLLKKKKKTNK